MKKELKKILLMATMIGAMVLPLSGCALKEASALERAQNVVDAYQAGDVDTFKSYIESDNSMNYMMDALNASEAEGMIEVYQKVYELTKTAEITVTEKENDPSGEYAVVTIKTVDFTSALNDAMAEAASENGEAFGDAPAWMMKALSTGGEAVEKEVEIRTKSNNSLYEGYNDEFYEAITGGFYDYIVSTMTTCKSNDEYDESTYMLATYDKVRVSLDEFVMSLEDAEYTEEEVQGIIDEFTADYEDYDGIKVGGVKVENGVRLYMLINYDEASFYTLERLDLASSGNTDTISLSASVKDFESDGYTCEKTDFGSGVMYE